MNWHTTLAMLAIASSALLLSAAPTPQQSAGPRYKAIAFDYFVVFDANSIMPAVEKAFPGRGEQFTKTWRAKQFEYANLRSIAGRYEDFFKVTEDALVYTAESMKLELTSDTKDRLLDAYLHLTPWPDTADSLRKLRAAGVKIITIANFSPKMLRSNADNAGLTPLFDELLSTEANGTYKPDPRAYALGMEHLQLKKEEILFAAFGGWDAFGAKSFGYPTYWVNRFNLPVERLGVQADNTSQNMDGLLQLVLGHS
jgi:2-haloacid dehalogenase